MANHYNGLESEVMAEPRLNEAIAEKIIAQNCELQNHGAAVHK